MDMIGRFQLKDVHELAQRIGAEFKRIIEEYGGTCVSSLLPIVTDSLEQLERHVEENKRLQSANCQLILENDSLANEREHSLQMIKQVEELQLSVQFECSEKRRFESLANTLQNEVSKLKGLDVGGATDDTAMDDTAERQLALESENRHLRCQLEEYKAEIALQSLQKSTVECVKDELPKFYKKDLLAVLRERNELKEQVDAVRDELAMAKQELCAACSQLVETPGRCRAETRVRHIINESVHFSDLLPHKEEQT